MIYFFSLTRCISCRGRLADSPSCSRPTSLKLPNARSLRQQKGPDLSLLFNSLLIFPPVTLIFTHIFALLKSRNFRTQSSGIQGSPAESLDIRGNQGCFPFNGQTRIFVSVSMERSGQCFSNI